MVGHQHVRVHGTAFAQGDFAQVLQVAHPVEVSKEARLAIIAALDNVLGYMGEVESGLARHGRVLAVTRPACRHPATGSVGECRLRMQESAL